LKKNNIEWRGLNFSMGKNCMGLSVPAVEILVCSF